MINIVYNKEIENNFEMKFSNNELCISRADVINFAVNLFCRYYPIF